VAIIVIAIIIAVVLVLVLEKSKEKKEKDEGKIEPSTGGKLFNLRFSRTINVKSN